MSDAITLAIFDLDGVIVNTSIYHYLAWKKLANQLGFDFTEEQNERLKGVSRMGSLEILLEIGGREVDEDTALELAEKKNRWYVDYLDELRPTNILPGVIEAIQYMRSKSVLTAVGSASKNAGLVLEKLELGSFFDVVGDGNSADKPKPDPGIFLFAARRLQIEPERCIVFEDAEVGIEAAKNAGMKAVGVGSARVLKEADFVISGFSESEFRRLKSRFTFSRIVEG